MYNLLIILMFFSSILPISAQNDSLNEFSFSPFEQNFDDLLRDSLIVFLDNSVGACDTALFIELSAQEDIENEKVLLLININQPALTKEDSLVQNKFGFQYSFFDPTYPFAPDNDYCDDPDLYNMQIFKYLEEKYGKVWQGKVRADIYAYRKINGR